jgi:zinc protease
MEFEADRMSNIILADDIVAAERRVVLEERSMRVESTPAEILREAIQAAMFTTHPYGKPVIGWREEIAALDRTDALAYYQNFYTPENALLVVAGDIEPAAAIELANQSYGPVARRDPKPKRNRPREPKPTTHRQVSLVDAKVAQQQFLRTYLVPSYRDAQPGEAEALDVLAFMLGRSQTGVLYKTLVMEARIASSVSVNYEGVAVENTRLTLSAMPGPGVSLSQLDDAIEAVIAERLRIGFDLADIERAKRRIVANAVYARDSQMALCRYYGGSLCIGMTIDEIRAWPERMAAVASDDVMNALRRLDKRRCVSGYLLGPEAGACPSPM